MSKQRLKKNEPEPETTLNLKARDAEDGDAELRDFVMTISVLQRDKSGMPVELIGTKVDVTEKRRQQQSQEEREMRYKAIFNTRLLGVMYFDKNGILTQINSTACEMFKCDREEALGSHIHLHQILDTSHLSLDQVDGYYASQLINLDKIPYNKRLVPVIKRRGMLCNEFYLMDVRDENNALLGIFAICRDVTHIRASLQNQRQKTNALHEKEKVLAEYNASIDSVLSGDSVWLVVYSVEHHMLSFYDKRGNVRHELSQTRCMSFADDRSKKSIMRLLVKMDERQDTEINVTIYTTLRNKARLQLSVLFCLRPVKDKNGQVTEYVGLCRDFSELHYLEQQMAVENDKLQEVEYTKSSFVKNMVQEIKAPLNRVVEYVNQLSPVAPSPDEERLTQGILSDADYLLHLINNVLFLSRLEAHMVEIKQQPCNFAEVFNGHCMEGWNNFQNANTRYQIENPYDELIVSIDVEHLGHAIRQLTANAAQHTKEGTVRVRYEYIGRRLIISIDDTGEGIPSEELERLTRQTDSHTLATKGLGLAICRELVKQMNGTLEITSEANLGTTVYLTIPCLATSIKRKRN
jgi:PAS domain S-box-containing protein